jgi:hypothetical protein
VDTYTVNVQSVSGNGREANSEPPVDHVVVVQAPSVNEATLTALEMVSCRRNPISAEVDWNNF